jgi:hypothetical protein
MRKVLALIIVLAAVAVAGATTNRLSVKQVDNVYTVNLGSSVDMTCGNTSYPYYVIVSQAVTLNPQDIVIAVARANGIQSTGIDIGLVWWINAGSSSSDTGDSFTLPMGFDYDTLTGANVVNAMGIDTGRSGTIYYNLVMLCQSTSTTGPVDVTAAQLQLTVLRR